MYAIFLKQCSVLVILFAYDWFSSAVVMALSTGHGVHMFTLDPTFGEFVMTRVCFKKKFKCVRIGWGIFFNRYFLVIFCF